MGWLLMFFVCGIIVYALFCTVEEREREEKYYSKKCDKKSRKITDILTILAVIFGFIGIFPIIYFIWYIFGGAVLIEGFDSFDTPEIIGSFIGSTICFIIVIIFIVALFSRK